MAPKIHGHRVALSFERVDSVQDPRGKDHESVQDRGDGDDRAELRWWPGVVLGDG